MELKLGFPIYSAEYYRHNGQHHLIVAGGGGTAATGVHNTLEIFKITPGQPGAPPVTSLAKATFEQSIPNIGLHGSFVAVSNGDRLQVFKLNHGEQSSDTAGAVRQRKEKKAETTNAEGVSFEEYGSAISHRSSDYINYPAGEDPVYQTCTAIGPGGTIISGGAEGAIKVYTQSQKSKLAHSYTIHGAHSKDLIQVSLQNSLLVSTGADGEAYLWRLSNNTYEKLWSLREAFQFDNKVHNKFKFKACSFFNHGWTDKPPLLVTAASPVLSKTNDSSVITVWKYAKDEVEKMQPIATRDLRQDCGVTKVSTRSIDVNAEFKLVAVGLENGGVLVFSLPFLEPYFRYEPSEGQGMFVTKVVLARANGSDTPVVITTDAANCVRVHQLKNNYGSSMSWSFYTVIAVALVFVFRLLFILYNDTLSSEKSAIDANQILDDMFSGKTAEEIMANDPYADLDSQPFDTTTNVPDVTTQMPEITPPELDATINIPAEPAIAGTLEQLASEIPPASEAVLTTPVPLTTGAPEVSP